MRTNISVDFTFDRQLGIAASFDEPADDIVSLVVEDSQARMSVRLARVEFERLITVVDRARSAFRDAEGAPQRSRFVTDIRRARAEGRLDKWFTPDDLRRTCPGWAHATYSAFLPQYRRGNPTQRDPYFEQGPDGRYSLIDGLEQA